MSGGNDYMKAVKNTTQGHIALNILSNDQGIVLGEFNETILDGKFNLAWIINV
jgi:hypothetical protein